MKLTIDQLRRKMVRRELDEQNKHNFYKFFDCVTKVTISENTDPKILKKFDEIGVVANVKYN